MKFMMPRNRVISFKMGHTIDFKKGELVHVPPECYDEAISLGGVPEHEIEETPQDANARPADPLKAKKAIFDAFTEIKLRNDTKDFTAGGVPHPKTLLRVLGWQVDAKERDTLWSEFMQIED